MNEIINPITGERIVFRDGMGDEAAPVLAFDFFLKPGGGVFVPHFHESQIETIVINKGKLVCTTEGREVQLGAGEKIVFKPGQGHTLYAAGSEEFHAFVEFRPAGKAESFLRNYFGLCRNGKSDHLGNLSLLQVSLLMPFHGNWRADIPILAQKFLFLILQPIAKLMGYKETYPEFGGTQNH
jgi:quercetin dioxygenase-like cupin family protein